MLLLFLRDAVCFRKFTFYAMLRIYGHIWTRLISTNIFLKTSKHLLQLLTWLFYILLLAAFKTYVKSRKAYMKRSVDGTNADHVKKCRQQNRKREVINNGNCTDWSAIWSEIKRVITICNHKFDFRPKLHDTKCNFHFTTFIMKSTSGNASLFTKYAPKLAPPCNIATCKQNGRDTKSGDTKQ